MGSLPLSSVKSQPAWEGAGFACLTRVAPWGSAVTGIPLPRGAGSVGIHCCRILRRENPWLTEYFDLEGQQSSMDGVTRWMKVPCIASGLRGWGEDWFGEVRKGRNV